MLQACLDEIKGNIFFIEIAPVNKPTVDSRILPYGLLQNK